MDNKKLQELILEEAKNGNVIVWGADGLMKMSLKDFVKDPVESILYDLYRDEATILTLMEDPKWVNDYAVMQVIRELKRQLDK